MEPWRLIVCLVSLPPNDIVSTNEYPYESEKPGELMNLDLLMAWRINF